MIYGWVKLTIAVLAAVSAAGVAVARAVVRARARSRMRSAPQQLVDHSVVTLTGTVKLIGEPLIAPLSGRQCVVHRSTARLLGAVRTHGALLSTRPVDQEHTKCELVPFTLVTREGDVLVEGSQVEIPLRGKPVIPRKLAREQSFLETEGLPGKAQDASFDELLIEPGAKISVHGIARVEVLADGAASYRETATRVRLVGEDRVPLTILLV